MAKESGYTTKVKSQYLWNIDPLFYSFVQYIQKTYHEGTVKDLLRRAVVMYAFKEFDLSFAKWKETQHDLQP